MTALINVDNDYDCGDFIRLFCDKRRYNHSKKSYDGRCLALNDFQGTVEKLIPK